MSKLNFPGAIVVSLIFLLLLFSIGEVQVDGMAEFFAWAGGGGCCMEYFVFWVI